MNISPTSGETYFPNFSGAGRDSPRVDSPEEAYAPTDTDANSASGVTATEDTSPQETGQNSTQNDSTVSGTESQTGETAPDGSQLTEEDLRLVQELKTVDDEVRRHEAAHMAAGGSLVTSSAQFSYKTGPDGQRYAVAGEVGIDTSAVPGDPQATIDKMEQVKQAALAPASPSSQDLKVAAQAASAITKSMGELTALMAKQQAAESGSPSQGSPSQAADSYSKVSTLPETDTATFELAV